MVYKLLHFMFRWDYIHWNNSAASGIARVRVLPDGTVYYWRYSITKVMDVITNKTQVHWLTCLPTKYLKEK